MNQLTEKNHMYTTTYLDGLRAYEAGWLLQKTLGQVRGMLRRGELQYARPDGGFIDPDSVRLHLDPFALGVLDLVASGVLRAPHPPTRYGKPEPYHADFARGVLFGLMFGPVFGYDV